MIKTYFFVVPRKKFRESADKDLFSQNLRRGFPSVAFMEGYAEGYGFGSISILTPEQLVTKHNGNFLKESYLFAVEVVQKVECKCSDCGGLCDG